MPLEIIRNDITKVKADAIVNTANPQVYVGSGVDQAIYEAAGAAKLIAERMKIGPMVPGQAAATPAFDLDAKYIIHTVGPAWIDGEHGEKEAVADCYRNSLALADELGCASAAFPLISTGTYGFPKDEALNIAVSEISKFLYTHEMTVYMVVYDREAFMLSSRAYSEIKSYIAESDVRLAHEAREDYYNKRRRRRLLSALMERRRKMRREKDENLASTMEVSSESFWGKQESSQEDQESFWGKQESSERDSYESFEDSIEFFESPADEEADHVPGSEYEKAAYPQNFRDEDALYSQSFSKEEIIDEGGLPEAGAGSPYEAFASADSTYEPEDSSYARKSSAKAPGNFYAPGSSAKAVGGPHAPVGSAKAPSNFYAPESSAKAAGSPHAPVGSAKAPGNFYAPGSSAKASSSAYAPVGSTYEGSIEDVLKRRGETFQQMLFRIIDRKGLSDPEVYKKANIDRKLFSKIRSNVDYVPSKRTILALAISLGLNLDETRDLLLRAGIALSPSSRFDLIMGYCIDHGMKDIHEINCILFEFGEPTLGA